MTARHRTKPLQPEPVKVVFKFPGDIAEKLTRMASKERMGLSKYCRQELTKLADGEA